MKESQDKILNYCLKNCVFDGWNNKLLANACFNAGLDENYWKIPFRRGTRDLLKYYEEQVNDELEKTFLKTDYKDLRTHQKIRQLIKLRLEILNENKPAMRAVVQASTLDYTEGLRQLYVISDKIWRVAGDSATNWNFYSKRAILSGVYVSTLMFWLDDKSVNHKSTWEFLDRRLAEVARFSKATAKFKNFGKDLSKKSKSA